MDASQLARRLMRLIAPGGLLLFWLAATATRGSAQDILLADFEETNYAWLPGGSWTVTGTAMGPGPAQGTLAGQQTVSGYLGKGLVNTFFNGDASTGTLTSPPFTITRTYLKFLIGAGNHRGQTCINLLVGGKVVLSAVGMGDREALDWLQWNVSGYLNQTAQLQIVDAYTNGWGHINVDQITETATSLPNLLVATNHYLNLPVSYTGTSHMVELLQKGLVVHEFNIALVTNGPPDYYAFLDLTAFQGELLVRVDSAAANASQLAAMVQATNLLTSAPIYQETTRPVYHYTARRGWLNDPNGMVFYNGQYHLYYQHNPYGTEWDNMHWGSAVSTNLVQWQELPEALYPDWLGAMWSGSAVVDANNSAGFGTNALVAFYTAAGGHSNNPRMSAGQLFTQCLAYSLDQGVTWTKYTNNPIIPNLVGGDNRDPKVIWYAPGNKWVLVLWLNNNDFGFFSSTDLKHWTQTSTFTFPNVIEVPELFQLPLDGETNNEPWVFWAGAGNYYTGQFDGNTFTAINGPKVIRQGNSMAAAQTFNNLPAADGRRILISQGTVAFTGAPFNSIMNFPVALTLQSGPAGPWLYANPVAEIAQLRLTTNTWPVQPLAGGVNALAGVTGEAFDLDAQFQPGATNQVVFNLAGTLVVYDAARQSVACAGLTNALSPSNGIVHLRFLVDRGSVEIFGNGGFLYMPMSVTPVAGPQPLGLTATGGGAQLLSLSLYNLGSAWSSAANVPLPTITGQPAPVTTELGGPAVFNVTATGLGALTYQWLSNGVPVAGATLPTLNLFPVAGSGVNYSVVVASTGGAVTSSVAPLTVIPPYNVAYWRMEAQITAPNNVGVGTFTGVADNDTAVGQGIYTTGILPAAIDDLITFNGLAGGPVTLATNTAPAAMFVNGHSAGSYSYNAEVLTNVDGVLFFPQDQYGDEMDFTGPFSIEAFFATDGKQNGAGTMALVSQGTDTGQTFRYDIDVNESAAGGVRFKVANASLGWTNYVDLTGANYADGQWHYLLAVCDTLAGTNGQMRLTIANADGSLASATNHLPAGFLPLPAADNGNLFLGRNTYPVAANPQTFRGFIDEVQITAGVVPDAWRIGNTVLAANPPVAAPGNPVYGGTTVTLSESPTGLAPFFFQWQVNGVNLPGATNSSLVLSNVTANSTNNYSVVVRNGNASSLSPSTPLAVIPQTQLYPFTNPPPSVVLLSPTNHAAYTASASVTLSADADAPFNPLIQVSFYANGTLLGGAASPPYALTATGLAAGNYGLTAVAVDGSGLAATSAPVNITVISGAGQPYGLTTNAAPPPFLNMPATYNGPLPLLLSQTGVFSNTPAMIPTNGLIPYAPNTPLWSDGALKTRYFMVPGSGGPPAPGGQIAFAPAGSWTFPAGSVFVKTFSLNTDTSNPNVLRRLETRLLVRDINGAVYGVTYKWRADNSDADLLSNSLTETITLTNATGLTTQTWYYPSPADCLTCHTPVANYVLGLNTRQLNGNTTYPATGVTDNQLRTLNRLGLLNPAFDEASITNFEKMSALTNLTATLQDRSRSYLDANCAQCHQPGGTGITFDARYDTPLASQNITNYPATVTLGYDNACMVRSQDVWRSMIYDRINATNAAYKMPPLARNLIDTNAVAVLAGWINSLPGIPALPPPVITPNGGSFQASVPVTMADPNPNATIYYTLDGSLPATNSLRYAGGLTFHNNASLAASAFAPGYNNSVAAGALFLVQPVAFTSQGFTNRVFQLAFTGIPGSNYVLEASTNLVNWTPLATNTALTNQFNWVDGQATNFPHRFYRVWQP